jgi:DNA-3-methyladenine glycosylase
VAIIQKLDSSFYDRTDVLVIARELIGKLLITDFNGEYTSGRIVETEAYAGITDKASHAFDNRRTDRTEVMFGAPGNAYVYLCYGIHHLFNVVTNKQDIPHAVLIRALEPVHGVEFMKQRTRQRNADRIASGPGKLSKAMGITTALSGHSLLGDKLYIADDGFLPSKKDIEANKRIGIDYAGKDALLPYRFILKGNSFVSR